MSKSYQVQVKFNKNDWTTVDNFLQQKDAMHYIQENTDENSRYPMRIVRVVKTVVFEGK